MTRNNEAFSLQYRLVSLLCSMVFAIPTAIFIWLVLNLEGAFVDIFFTSKWLWGTILAFAFVSFLAPKFFVELLGAIWQLIYRLAKWF